MVGGGLVSTTLGFLVEVSACPSPTPLPPIFPSPLSQMRLPFLPRVLSSYLLPPCSLSQPNPLSPGIGSSRPLLSSPLSLFLSPPMPPLSNLPSFLSPSPSSHYSLPFPHERTPCPQERSYDVVQRSTAVERSKQSWAVKITHGLSFLVCFPAAAHVYAMIHLLAMALMALKGPAAVTHRPNTAI